MLWYNSQYLPQISCIRFIQTMWSKLKSPILADMVWPKAVYIPFGYKVLNFRVTVIWNNFDLGHPVFWNTLVRVCILPYQINVIEGLSQDTSHKYLYL